MSDELFHLSVYDENGKVVINDIYIGFDAVADLMYKYSAYKRKEILRNLIDDSLGIIVDRNSHYIVGLEKIHNKICKILPSIKQSTFKYFLELYTKYGEGVEIHYILSEYNCRDYNLISGLVYKDTDGQFRRIENDEVIDRKNVSYSYKFIIYKSLLDNFSYIHDLIDDYKDELIFKYCTYQHKEDKTLLLQVVELLPFNQSSQLVLMCKDANGVKEIYSRGTFLSKFDIL